LVPDSVNYPARSRGTERSYHGNQNKGICRMNLRNENEIGRSMLSDIEKELEKSTLYIKEIYLQLADFLESTIKEHFRWLMAINVGSLVWIISSVDKFLIADVLFWKYIYIVIVLLQMFSSVMFFAFNGMIFVASLQTRLIKIDVSNPDFIQQINKIQIQLDEIKKRLPGVKATIMAEVAFVLSFIFLAVYIISFIIKNR